MLQAVKSNLILYATDLCLMYQHKDIVIIRKILNEDFENICDWFVDKKLSINFGDDKTKIQRNKGTAIQIEKALINDHLRVSKIS